MSKAKVVGPAATPGAIQPEIMYRADEARKRLGWGQRAWDSARRRGLQSRIHKSGKWAYVMGSDLIAFIATPAAAETEN